MCQKCRTRKHSHLIISTTSGVCDRAHKNANHVCIGFSPHARTHARSSQLARSTPAVSNLVPGGHVCLQSSAQPRQPRDATLIIVVHKWCFRNYCHRLGPVCRATAGGDCKIIASRQCTAMECTGKCVNLLGAHAWILWNLSNKLWACAAATDGASVLFVCVCVFVLLFEVAVQKH